MRKLFIIDREFLCSFRKRAALERLGFTFPPPRGWKSQLIGLHALLEGADLIIFNPDGTVRSSPANVIDEIFRQSFDENAEAMTPDEMAWEVINSPEFVEAFEKWVVDFKKPKWQLFIIDEEFLGSVCERTTFAQLGFKCPPPKEWKSQLIGLHAMLEGEELIVFNPDGTVRSLPHKDVSHPVAPALVGDASEADVAGRIEPMKKRSS